MIIKNTCLRVVRGSALDEKADVIVNAANKELMRGGGICGAIYEAAGSRDLELYIKQFYPKGSPTGVAVITPAFKLPHKAIIHVAGPMWQGGIRNEKMDLMCSYLSSLRRAADFKYKSIVFCSISTGIYGYPLEKAADTAIRTIIDFLENSNHNFTQVKLAMFGQAEFEAYQLALWKVHRERRNQRRREKRKQTKIEWTEIPGAAESLLTPTKDDGQCYAEKVASMHLQGDSIISL